MVAAAHPGDEPAKPRSGVPVAARRAPAGHLQRANARPRAARVPGALAARRIGRVQHQRSQGLAVAEGVGLSQEGPVGVAVERDAAEAQSPAHGVDVVGRGGGSVGIEAGAELLSAPGDDDLALDAPVLGAAAVKPLRHAGAAHVDKNQPASLEQASEGRDVVPGAAGRGVAGPALDGEDGSQRGPGAIRARPQREADLGRAQPRVGPLEGDGDLAAAKAAQQPAGAGSEAARSAGVRLARLARGATRGTRRRGEGDRQDEGDDAGGQGDGAHHHDANKRPRQGEWPLRPR